MKKLRKFLNVSVMVLTVVVTSGFGSLANAAAPQAGDLIKMDGLSSVYYLGADGKRYVFPTSSTYFSWYKDFSGVITVSASELQSYPLGSNVTMRPGTKLVKITTDPSVYAVTPNSVLKKISSEADAIALYGTSWAKRVVDVPDAFFTNYTIGSALASGEVPAGSLVKNSGSASVYYYDGSNYRNIASESAFNANHFSFDNVLTIASTVAAGGSAISGSEGAIVSPTGATTGVKPGTGTGLTASLSADTPAAQNVPSTVAVSMLKVNITASNDGDINVNGLRLTAGGLGAANEIKQVSVYKDGIKLNNTAKDVSSSDKYAEINFTNPLVVSKGTTATLEVRAKISGTNDYSLNIAKAGDIMTTASVSGSFPVNGNIMSAKSVSDLGYIDASQDGGSLANVKLGDSQATVAKFKLEANKEDITFKSISLKRTDPSNGTAISDGDLTNIKLYKDGSVIASASGITNKYVNFTLSNPVVIKDGSTARFEVKADPIDGAGKYVKFVLDSDTDIVATGNHYGYQARINTNTIGSDVLIDAGAITITKTNAVNDKIKKDIKKVEAGSFSIKVNNGKNVELSTTYLTLNTTDNDTSSSSPASIENVQLYDRTTGTSYDMTYVATTTSSATKIYKNDSMGLYMHGGETHELVVRFDTIKEAAAEDYTFSIKNAASDLVIKETANDTRITDITPNSVELKKVSIQDASATITANALSSTLSATAGSADVEAYNFNIKAGESSGVKVNNLTFADFTGTSTVVTNGNANNQYISDLKLWQGSTLVASKSSSQLSNGQVTFDNLSQVIPANTTVAYKLTVSLVKRSDITNQTVSFGINGYDMEDTDKGDTISGIILPTTRYTRTIAIVGDATLHMYVDNTVDATKYDSYALAGTDSNALASIKMKADNGAAKLTKLRITTDGLNSTTTPSNVFSELSLWDGATKVAATTDLSNATILFDNINLVVPTSEKTYTLKGKLNNIGKDQAGVFGQHITFAVANNSEAEDNASGDDLTVAGSHLIIGTTASKTVYPVATMISAISSETADGQGHNVDTKLGAGNNIVGILKVTVPTTNNTKMDGTQVKTLINSFKIQANVTGATTTMMTVEKVGGSGSSLNASSTAPVASNGNGTWTIGVKDGDQEVTPGTTVYYIVRATMSDVPGSNTASASFQAKFDSLNDAGNITWQDTSNNTTSYTKLLINGLNSLDFPKLNN